MALLGEEVVEEWLNRQGYFTIRGVKIGVHEMDILAFKPNPNGKHECRHIEVQVSTNPIAYISKVPKAIQKAKGMGPDNAKERTPAELAQGVKEWIHKKFDHEKKQELRKQLYPGKWTRELVVNEVKHREELEVFKKEEIVIISLSDVVRSLMNKRLPIEAAAGNDLMTLMLLGRRQVEKQA